MASSSLSPQSESVVPGALARVALETTLLLHGVPKAAALDLFDDLEAVVEREGARACTIGVLDGAGIVGLSRAQVRRLLEQPSVAKVNTSTLGLALARGLSGATTVSTTMELAAGAGIRVFATGGLGGVHRGYGQRLDISTDLLALTRFPVAVVASGSKSILDVPSTRELLETLGVPVVGWETDRFPAFYQRDSGVGLDGRFDDLGELAAYVRSELARTGRGLVVACPIPEADEIPASQWLAWLAEAELTAAREGASGRDVTPALLAAVHGISGGATLKANVALVKNNARLAARLAVALAKA